MEDLFFSKHRAVEKINGVNERDNGVRMVTFAQANKGRSLEDFAEKARNLSWIKSMSESDAQCMIAFGCAVLAKLSGVNYPPPKGGGLQWNISRYFLPVSSNSPHC